MRLLLRDENARELGDRGKGDLVKTSGRQSGRVVSPGLIDDSHTTPAELFKNAVVRNIQSQQGWGIRHGVAILAPPSGWLHETPERERLKVAGPGWFHRLQRVKYQIHSASAINW